MSECSGVADSYIRVPSPPDRATNEGPRAGNARGEMTGPDLDSPQFVERIRRRDREAIAAVVDAYLGQVVRAARGAGLDGAAAEDVAQATFLTFIETAPRFEGRSRVRTWLFGILFRKVAEARRARARDGWSELDERFEQRFDETGNRVRPPRSADFDLGTAELGAAITACLEAASTRSRMAFALREVDGLTTDEICKILDVSVTNLGVILHRVRNRLRECLAAKGIAA